MSYKRRLWLPGLLVAAALVVVVISSIAGASHIAADLVSVGPSGGNGNSPARFAGASDDGVRAFFETGESLVSADGDSAVDVYARSGFTTTLVSSGPSGGNGSADARFGGSSQDGTRVFFETAESLVPSDTDSKKDVYERIGGTTTLMSTGPSGGNGSADARFAGASEDGAHVFIETTESLVAPDLDSARDVYERSSGTTSLVSTGVSGGNGATDAFFSATSEDGSKAFFVTTESLVAGDTDSARDAYERSGATTTLLSTGASGGNGQVTVFFNAASADGSKVFFQTTESLVAADTDSSADIYEHAGGAGGATSLVSTSGVGSNGAFNVHFDGASDDGSYVFFNTEESLASADTDSFRDIYERSGGLTRLVSRGGGGGNGAFGAEFTGVSEDGTKVFFDTDESLLAFDTDAYIDVYERSGGTTKLLSRDTGTAGNGPYDSDYAGISADGNHVFFSTLDPLMAADTDSARDIYERSGGVTTLVSHGPAGGNGGPSAQFAHASSDGSRVLLQTSESLVSADSDSQADVYRSAAGGTLTVVVDAEPDNAQDFDFTFAGGPGATSFQLDDDADPTLANTKVMNDVVPGSGYSLSQVLPSLWLELSATCDDGSPVSNVDVAPGESVTCTFTNTQRGRIVVVKDAQPDDPQDFLFTTGGGLVPGSFTLDDDLDPALSNTETIDNVVPDGGYSLSETVPSGWDLTSASCDDGSPISSIDISVGETVTCTFENRKRGSIVVVKDAQPNDAQDFGFTAGGGLSPTSFSLDDDSNPTLSNSRTFANVVPGGGYSLSETVPADWDQTSATCDDASPLSNIDVGPGETVTCTFTNRKRGSIVVVKDAQPNDAQDFDFTAGGGLSPASFSLDDDSDPTLANTRTFADVPAGGGYSLSETVPADWDQTAATCDDGSPVSSIDLAPGETVTCTFTNRKVGSIVVVQDSTPNDAQDFSFTAGGGLSPFSFSLDDDSDGTLASTRTFANLTPTDGYSIAQSLPSGWDSTGATCSDGSPISNIDVAAGETVTCTFANRKRGNVVVVKDAQPNDPQDFSFTAGGGLSPASFSLDDDSNPTLASSRTFANVVPGGGYSLSETVPADWDQTSATCDDGSPLSNIDVTPGETVTCTFTNRKRGQIVVAQDSTPEDPQDFAFTAGGGLSPASFSLDDDSDPTLPATLTLSGVAPNSGYSLSQTIPSGWDQTSATCDDGSTVTSISVSPGETVTCTFENRKRGSIVVVKDAQPNDAQDFDFTAGGGLSPTSFSLDDDADGTLSNMRTFASVVPGGYSLSETVPSGWDQAAATCDDGSPLSNINLAPGETVTCTFTNRKRGQIVVVQDSTPNDAQDFAFTAGGGLSPSSFSLDDDSDGTLAASRTFANVVASGGYSLSQTVPSGWDQTAASCDDGSPVSNINVATGETVTCTFADRKRGQILAVQDSTPNDPQDFAFTAGGGLSPTSFSLDDDSDGTLAASRTFANVVPGGGFSLSQTVPSGWDQTAATCDDGSPVSNISVSAGEIVTCTFADRKRGSIVVVKDAVPNDNQNFNFTATGGLSPSVFALDDDSNPPHSNTQTFTNVPAGGYSVAEAVPSGWDQMSATCDDGSPNYAIDLAPGETVTCTFTNRKRGQIIVVQDSTPNDAQDFAFTAGGGLSPSSFSLDDDSDGTLAASRTFANVVPGGYSLSQTVPSGWDQTSATCSDGSPISNIDVGAGETVTCTFANRKRGNVVVVKDAQPNDAQDFAFTAGGGLSPTSFSLDDDSDGTLANSRTFANVVPASGYSLSETVPGGWDQSSATCSDGSPVSNIDVAAGETVTCTFTNRKRGSVVVVKDAQPNDAQDFAFTAGGGLSPASFSLDDDSDPALSNTRTFSSVPASGGYSLSETVPADWYQSAATCDDGSPVSNIDVGPGETVTCTFTNRKRGQIIVVQDSTPNDAQNFDFTAGGGLSPSSFSLDDDSDGTLAASRTFNNVAPISGYSVAQALPSGWDSTGATCSDGSPISNIDVGAGETVTCTFTNRKRGNVVVVKDALPNDPQDFSFTAGGGLSPASFSLDDDSDGTLSNTRTFASVVPGAGYSLSETVPSGWDQTSATCDDGSPLSNIDVAPGETVTCTFTNRKRGQVVVVQDSSPDDPQDFAFTAGGGLSPSSFSLDDDSDGTLAASRTFANVVPGGYSLDQTVPSGWDQTSATCDDGSPVSSISVSAGETVTCTFADRKRGSVVVVKDAQPNDAQDFDFTAGGGLSPASFSLDDDSNPSLSNTRTFANVVPGGGYSLSETVPSGWVQSAASCDDGSPVASIDVGPGETVTCTFTNRERGTIVVVKDAQPNDPQDFSFTTGGGLSPASFSLDDDSDPTLANTRTFTDVPAGSGYSLSETVPGGWVQSAASCNDGSPLSNIDVGPGETVTCTFTNRKSGTIVVVQDSTPNDAQDFDFTAGGGLSPTSFSLDDDSDGTLAASHTFNNVAPTSGYSVAQSLPSGWDSTGATCSDGSPVSNIDVGAGETVTCTFTNRKRGSIVVTKDAQPNDAQNFNFTATGGLSPSVFALDDDSDPTLSNTRTFTDVPAGAYSVAEGVPSGWDQTSATCDDGSPNYDINLAPGETVHCTFTNRKRGSIVVVQDSTPNDAQDFAFTAGGGLSPSSFSLDDDSDGTLAASRTFANVTPGGGYSLSQSVPGGWDQTAATCDDGSAVSSISVSAGEAVTCTFADSKRGSIVVVKDAQPDDAQDFDFTAGGGLSPASFQLDDDSDPTLSNTRTLDAASGSGYSVEESLPAGWEQISATCDDGSPISSITVSAGETVTCTFTNRRPGSVVAVLDAQPNDAQDFDFTAGGGLSPSSFSLDDDSDPTLANTRSFVAPPGSGYSLAQTVPAGWDLTSATCDDGSPVSNIAVSAEESVTCTFTNRKRGSLTVLKDAVPDDAQDFDLTAGGGLSPTSFMLDDDSDATLSNTRTFADLVPQAGYSVAETLPSGWVQTSASCNDGSPISNIDIAPGENVICTFVNAKTAGGGFPRPQGALNLRVPLAIAYDECAPPGNRTHGPALQQPSCSPPVQASDYLTAGTLDSNGKAVQLSGFARYRAIPGTSSTSEDEADVELQIGLSDVRRKADLSDYPGELEGRAILRITDKSNGSGFTESGTVVDIPFPFTVPCTLTATGDIGSSCAVTTTADAVISGAVRENRRTIWEIGQIEVYDGGPDDLAGTPGSNTPFARQGVFVP